MVLKDFIFVISVESYEIDLSKFQEDEQEEDVMETEAGTQIGTAAAEPPAQNEGSGLAVMRQRDLIQWYIGQQNEKNNYNSIEEAAAEVSKLKAIIESLKRREGHLVVVYDGSEAPVEDGHQTKTSRNDRILVVAPNYALD